MSITLTEIAANEVKKVLSEQDMNIDEYMLRVGVSGGGCAGFQYSLSFDKINTIDEQNDIKMNFNGLTVVVDTKSDMYIDGTVVDFYQGLEKRGFTFNNPNTSGKGCGCGKSFNV